VSTSILAQVPLGSPAEGPTREDVQLLIESGIVNRFVVEDPLQYRGMVDDSDSDDDSDCSEDSDMQLEVPYEDGLQGLGGTREAITDIEMTCGRLGECLNIKLLKGEKLALQVKWQKRNVTTNPESKKPGVVGMSKLSADEKRNCLVELAVLA
jgi:hypothetical protein